MKEQFSAGVITYFKKKVGDRGTAKIEYLLLHYQAGHWDFPKGKIENGETKQQAALRELKEEADLQLKLNNDFEYSFSYFFKYKSDELIKKTVYFFIGQADTKKVKLSHEHIDYDWLELEPALKRLTYKNAKELLKEVDKFLR